MSESGLPLFAASTAHRAPASVPGFLPLHPGTTVTTWVGTGLYFVSYKMLRSRFGVGVLGAFGSVSAGGVTGWSASLAFSGAFGVVFAGGGFFAAAFLVMAIMCISSWLPMRRALLLSAWC